MKLNTTSKKPIKKKRDKQAKKTRQTSNRSNLSPFLLSSSLPPSSLIQHFPFLSLYISIERDCEKRNPSGSIVANKSATSQRDAFDFMESKRRAEPSRAEPSRAEQSRAEPRAFVWETRRMHYVFIALLT